MKLLKNIFVIFVLTTICISSADAQKKKKKKKSKTGFETQIDSVSYALGLMIAPNLKAGGLVDLNYELYNQAIQDFLKENDLLIAEDNAREIVNGYVMKEMKQQAVANLEMVNKFLEENKKKKGIITTESGLQYEILKEGEGESPALSDNITAHYHGTLMDGTVFDSSVDRGEPVQFPVDGVIKGWTEALQLMKVGGKWKLYIPPDLGYGEKAPPGSKIEPNALLIFEVELISIDQ
jgi:FKBP-type peptidyl-prolyl cis-trans isomerase FklB